MAGRLRSEGRAMRVVGSGPALLDPGVFVETVNMVLVRLWALRSALWGS